MRRRKISLGEMIALGIANGILIGGALATSHRGHYIAVAVGTGMFITFTYLRFTCLRRGQQ